MRSLQVVIVAATAALLLPCAPADAAPVRLFATVGPGSAITLKTASGRDVSAIKQGVYVIVVNDRSPSDNFTLLGRGGMQRRTTAQFVGKTTWRLRLQRGTRYVYFSEAHRSLMTGAFRVV